MTSTSPTVAAPLPDIVVAAWTVLVLFALSTAALVGLDWLFPYYAAMDGCIEGLALFCAAMQLTLAALGLGVLPRLVREPATRRFSTFLLAAACGCALYALANRQIFPFFWH